MIYKNAKIIKENEIICGDVKVENGIITEIGQNLSGGEETNLDGKYICPGFVDVHVHGGGGYSAMSENPEDIVKMAEAHARHGVTSIVPTTLTAPLPALTAAIKSIETAMEMSEKAHILGIHLEGPYISPSKKGAQSEDDILVPTKNPVSELLDLSDKILIMGAAPEIDGGLELGEEIKSRGIVASVAHSDASYEKTVEALKGGYSDVTHIYSACSSMHKEGNFRIAGVAEAGLTTPCTTQFIGDLRHLPIGIVKMIWLCKGADYAYAISDGLEFAAMDISESEVYTQKNGLATVYKDGVMQLADLSCLAGSVTNMHDILKNLYGIGIPLTDCVKMCSTTPARVVGYGKTKGKIEEGYDADLVIMDENLDLVSVIVK